MEDKTITLIVALICLTFLEATALCMGINGVAFATVIAAISGLAGFQIKDHSAQIRTLFSR